MDGNIMVNGVLASCYASVDHNLGHIGMSPVRSFPEMLEWTFGWDDGSSAFTKMAKKLSKSLLPFGQH